MNSALPAAPPPDRPFEASDWAKLAAASPSAAPQAHAIRFTGSGSEYFRIWIVNLLLTLVTLGLYHPWAKVRKLRYFYGNTLLADHAFDFHGEPMRMLRGYLLVGALFALYAFAGNVSPVAGLVALVIVAAIWPALMRASMRFRLAQTSWRGLRFQFNGSTAGAYKALLPGFAAVIVMIATTVWMAPDAPAAGAGAAGAARAAPPSSLALAAFFGSLVLLWASLPYTFWLLKRYQHDHYQYASVRTRLTAGPGSFYKLGFKTLGVMLAAGLAGGLLAAALGAGAAFGGSRGVAAVVGMVISLLALYGVMLFVLQPYVVSRLQNLVWSKTESRRIGFVSALRLGPLARLTALNWVLIVFTLGLYWPFAAVAMARLRLESVQVLARGDLDALVSPGMHNVRDASGDAAADLFGIDIGM